MQQIRTLVNICIVIAVYYLVYYIYTGILNPVPALGDSWDYHIPISQSILNTSFLSSPHTSSSENYIPHTPDNRLKMPQRYYPGSAEAINSLFILLRIPLTLSNIFATLVLFFSLRALALAYRLNRDYALLFAIAFCTLTVVLRWQNAVSVDMWVGVFFALSLILLESPRKNWLYFAKLGFVLGMLIGTKYSAVLLVIALLVLYGRQFVRSISLKGLFLIFIPFTLFGLFWYIRNFLLTGSPVYPFPFISVFRNINPFAFYNNVWTTSITHPLEMFNAGFGEYKLWLFSVLAGISALFYQFVIKRHFRLNSAAKLFILGLLNLACFFLYPSSNQEWIMVSSFRYSLPVFIPLILGVFILAVKHNKGEWLGYAVIANMTGSLSMAYYPKLTLISLPASMALIWYLNKGKKLENMNLN